LEEGTKDTYIWSYKHQSPSRALQDLTNLAHPPIQNQHLAVKGHPGKKSLMVLSLPFRSKAFNLAYTKFKLIKDNVPFMQADLDVMEAA
jgi:hypothetical protein